MLVSTDGRFSTHTRRWRFSGPVTDVLCKLPFAEFFEKNRIRCKRSLPDFTSDVSKIAVDRPLSKMRQCANDPEQTVTNDSYPAVKALQIPAHCARKPNRPESFCRISASENRDRVVPKAL
jgi:hypothetical protein